MKLRPESVWSGFASRKKLPSPSIVRLGKHRQPEHSKDTSGCTCSDQGAHGICARRQAHCTCAHIPCPRTHPMGARITDHPRTLDALICTVSACTLSRTWLLPVCTPSMHVSYPHQMTIHIPSSACLLGACFIIHVLSLPDRMH